MNIFKLILGCGICMVALACSSETEQSKTFIRGKITVADSVDSSGNYKGIGLTLITKDSANAEADTLFHDRTDRDGNFRGQVTFNNKKRYPMIVSRNGSNLARFNVILASGDTINIKGQLPNLDATLELDSREHDAMEAFKRVNRGYQRVAKYVQAGKLETDSLGKELDKWSNLFWEVYSDHKGTLASVLAASECVRILHGWNNKAMMEKIRRIQNEAQLIRLAATYGKEYLAGDKGLGYTIKYLDTLQQQSENKNVAMRVAMEEVKLLYDSARVEEAKNKLNSFRSAYGENKNARKWAESMSYDLNYLSPGDTVPSFSFRENGKTISRDSLIGTPYILEITSFDNSLYQQQYDRTVVIHSIYKNFGLQVITLPLDMNQFTIDAFFEERLQPWPVAGADAFDRKKLLEKFNVKRLPSRFLINRKGEIVRKYMGREFEDVIEGIQMLIRKEKQAS